MQIKNFPWGSFPMEKMLGFDTCPFLQVESNYESISYQKCNVLRPGVSIVWIKLEKLAKIEKLNKRRSTIVTAMYYQNSAAIAKKLLQKNRAYCVWPFYS